MDSSRNNMVVAAKVCSRCKEEKPIIQFGKDRSRKGGLRRYCFKCQNEKNRQWLIENRTYRREYMRAYAVSPQGRFHRLKTKLAKQGKHIAFTQATFVDWFIRQSKECYYCGCSFNGQHSRDFCTIDRKDNGKGYQLKNMALACLRCNTIKSDLFTSEEMRDIAERYIKPKLR